MFDLFSDGARRVMNIARDSAHRLHAPEIGTEHILLGIVDHGAGSATRRHLESALQPLALPAGEPSLLFTMEAKAALETALAIARHGGIGIEPWHLLLGVLWDEAGGAARLVRERGLSIEPLRRTVAEFLGQSRIRFDRYDDEARAAILASGPPQRRSLASILLGERYSACRLLRSQGVDVASIRAALEGSAGEPDEGDLRLELALEEADSMGRRRVGTEHLLLGMLRAGGRAARVLLEHGVDPDRVRSDVAGAAR